MVFFKDYYWWLL